MNTNNLKTITSVISSTLIAGAVLGTVATDSAHAQSKTTTTIRRNAKPAGFSAKRVNPASKRVSMELQNASSRKAIAQLFQQTGVDYSLDAGVKGNVTLKVRNKPFDVALRTLLNNSSQPLTYSVENGTYFIKPMPTMSSVPATARVAQTDTVDETAAPAYASVDATPQYPPAQQIGTNTVFVPSTGVLYTGNGGNTVLLPGGYGGYGYGNYGFGSYGGYNGFGGGYVPSFTGITIDAPGFYNPSTGIGAYYGAPNGVNYYNTSGVYLGF